MSCGPGEYLVIVFVLVVIFSASRMGAIGNALGKFVYSFRKAAGGEGYVNAPRNTSRLPRKDAQIEDAEVVDDKKK